MKQIFKAHDFIALVMIVGAFVLAYTKEDVTAPMLLTTIAGFYFGTKTKPSSDTNI